ncbi:hypothetical protein BDN71DRAFT_543722 [Pleurotus eryngii]|uniref:Uncharacterized protein n=1 Tax=Pleurotus eryngii TaxID=5323 RepID=A0A9P5ZIE9_PLEER|nr:hypothetical protein BDN71DRAFT_543722 [Pleurotus eryngii]
MLRDEITLDLLVSLERLSIRQARLKDQGIHYTITLIPCNISVRSRGEVSPPPIPKLLEYNYGNLVSMTNLSTKRWPPTALWNMFDVAITIDCTSLGEFNNLTRLLTLYSQLHEYIVSQLLR